MKARFLYDLKIAARLISIPWYGLSGCFPCLWSGIIKVLDDQGDEEAKKRQKRGGKGMVKAKKKEAELEKRITLSIAPRGKKKAVTVVQGKPCVL